MADQIEVNPTPIQRNAMDVAIELLQMQVRVSNVKVEDYGKLYAQYYVMAKTLSAKHYKDLVNFLPEDIKSKL